MCHSPLSYVLEVVVDCDVEMAVREEMAVTVEKGGARPTGKAAASGGITVFGGTEVVGIGSDVPVTANAAGGDVKLGDVASVERVTEEVASTVVEAVKMWVVDPAMGSDDGVFSMLTTAYLGLEDVSEDDGAVGEEDDDNDIVLVMSRVTLTPGISTVSDALTTAVDVTVCVVGEIVTVGSVIVLVWSEVWTTVVVAGVLDSDDVAAEPPSTATTE